MIKNSLVPTIIEKSRDGERVYDVYSRLLKDRIIFLHGEVEDSMADTIIAQLLLLEAQDPNAPITLYINSPGGSVTAGLAIKNTMDYITCDVITCGMGSCASMGAFLLASGCKGKRYALKDTEVMIHEVSSGTRGKVHDQKVSFEQSMKLNNKLMRYLSEYTDGSTSIEEMTEICKRDKWLEASEALEMKLIDNIITTRAELNK